MVWDFDGTLADTRSRNLEITRQIFETLTDRCWTSVPALADVEVYGDAVHRSANWRRLYVEHFDLPIESTHEAADLWTELHRGDRIPPPLFDGIPAVLEALGTIRQGIVSQNGRENIERALEASGVLGHFEHIVADEDLPFEHQKPEPHGLLDCAASLGDEPSGTVVYIGDHPVDVECVRRARAWLGRRGTPWQVVSIGAEYGDAAPHRWRHAPDHVAETPQAILEIVRRLSKAPARPAS